MIGPVINSTSLAAGSIIGAIFASCIPLRVKSSLPLMVGIITLSLGSSLTGKAAHFPVVVLSIIVGAAIGELFYFERGLETAIRRLMAHSKEKGGVTREEFVLQYITLISALCFGSMGLFGALEEGITGNVGILLTKSVLDLCSGIIFGASMGARIGLIAIPQFVILAGLCWSGSLIMPLITAEMLQNFTSTGGIIFLATGIRMCGIKTIPIITMIPSLVLIFPLTRLWVWLGL